MAKWPSGVPVFRLTGSTFIGTGVNVVDYYPCVAGYFLHDPTGVFYGVAGIDGLRALNADARAMLAIAKQGGKR